MVFFLQIWENTFNCKGNYSTCRLNPASYVPDLGKMYAHMVIVYVTYLISSTECAKNKCKEYFKKQESLDDTNIRDRTQADFSGIDLDKKTEVSFFSDSKWEDISDCDALIHVPTKDVPCEAL